MDSSFFAELPDLPHVPVEQADVAWFVYELRPDAATERYQLAHSQTVYTQFVSALQRITNAEPGEETDFLRVLQRKLKEKQQGSVPSLDAALQDVFVQEESEE